MAESQSRFSIIEELTNKKIETDDKIESLNKEKENNVLNLKRWEKAVVDERTKREEDTSLRLSQISREITVLEARKDEIEKAIVAIQNISSEKK